MISSKQANIMGMRGIPGSRKFFLMKTYKNPKVSVVIKSQTKNKVASKKNSNDPVVMRKVL
jgi:hypothetical protein